MQVQSANAIDDLLFAEIAIDCQVLERLQGLGGDNACNMGHISIDPGLLSATLRRGGGLFHTECIRTVMGHINPSECGNLQALLRSAMGTVPEHVEAVGVLPAFGHE